jgi:hypothetical protein
MVSKEIKPGLKRRLLENENIDCLLHIGRQYALCSKENSVPAGC